MLGARAFPLALLLSLIVLQCTSAATPAPKEAQKLPAPAPASPVPQAKLANSNAGASKQQYQEPAERSYGAEEPYPNRNMKRGEPKERPYAEQRSGDGYSKYGRPQEGPKPYDKPADSYGPDYGDKGPYDGPRDAYDEPRDAYDSEPKEDGYGEPKAKPAPCPKAKSADAVENVLLGIGHFKWSEEAQKAAQMLRSSRKSQTRAARKASTGPEDVSLEEPATDAAAKASIASVGVASAGKDRAVRTAAAIPSYGRDPGMYDPASLLNVAPEVSGKGATGTYSDRMVPTAEGLAVGPHVGANANPTFATVLHCVNAVAEIFYMSKKSGMAIKTAAFRTSKLTSTKLELATIAAKVNSKAVDLTHGDPSAFFDVEAERWVLTWASYPDEASTADEVQACLYVAVSHGVDPLLDWTVYALAARPQLAPGMRFCDAAKSSFSPMAPQTSFSKDGIFISIGAYCKTAMNPKGESFYPDATPGIMSTLFAYSKAALYDCENDDDERKIYAATYLGSFAWKSSISYKEQSLIKEDYRTFNNLITPARPQDEQDMKDAPLFVMKVDNAYMSVATLTDEPLAAMDCIENAPSIRAIIIGKGEDFGNVEGASEGVCRMPQPEDNGVTLDAGDCGMLGGKYGIRTYGTIHHRGYLYTTMGEFFGKDELRMPSIYWAIISTHPGSGLCKAARKKWGFIASADGLALGYPVIAARKDGGALVVYAFSGAGDLPHGLGAAHPGVASSIVGVKHGYGYEQGPTIDIIKLGDASIQQCDDSEYAGESSDCVARWGDYSASQVFGGHMWFAVPYAGDIHDYDFRAQWRSWIAVDTL